MRRDTEVGFDGLKKWYRQLPRLLEHFVRTPRNERQRGREEVGRVEEKVDRPPKLFSRLQVLPPPYGPGWNGGTSPLGEE